MFPVLFTVGDVAVYTFGVMLAGGFVTATLVAFIGLRRQGADVQVFWDVAFLLLFGGLVGARIHYGINNFDGFWNACFHPERVGRTEANCLEIFRIWRGGLAWFGGFILAVSSGMLYVRLRGYRPLQWADVITPAAFLGLAVGRIGCFAAADDFGKPTDLPWAMSFPSLIGYPDMQNRPIHPAQLYMIVKNLTVFGVGYVWLLPRKKFHGQVTCVSTGLYCFLRFFVEIFRGDYRRGFIFEWDVLPPHGPDFMSNGQMLCLILLVASIVGYLVLRRRPLHPAATP